MQAIVAISFRWIMFIATILHQGSGFQLRVGLITARILLRWTPTTHNIDGASGHCQSSLRFGSSGIPDASEDAAEFQKSYRLSGVGKRSSVQISTDTGHELATDVPKKMGGSDTAPQPVETLLAAWMGCTQATALFVGRQMKPRVLIESLEFDNIEAFRDERGALTLPIDEDPTIPSRLQRVTGTIRIRTRGPDPLTSKELELLKEQTELRCPVANMMIASGCSMDVEWMVGPTGGL